MIPELGNLALALALAVAVVLSVVPLAGALRGNHAWMAVAHPASMVMLLLLMLAYACLSWAFVAHDFSVLYVAGNSHTELPLVYRLTAVWGGHEGSLLLWLVMLGGWTVAVSVFSRALPEVFTARVLAVLGMVSLGFIAFTLFTSNPFERLFPAPMQGTDLNPLLQDPGMIVHPPLLYMGYVGFAVAYALAVAALIGGRLDSAWARWSRPWTTAAWLFLTAGIALGSWWAYYELGWGGWWFWDPVENASFLPWLVGTALIHSLAVTEKRGAFKIWTVLLAISAFALSLLGTFLVRSGVLTSVHAFATDPERGAFLLGFFVIAVGAPLLLYAWRAPRVRSVVSFELFSRETLMLANNVFLVTAAATVMLGTLYPLIMDALGQGRISVGPPYFEAVFVPLMLPLLLLVGLGPWVAWKRADAAALARRLWLTFGSAVALSAVLMLWLWGQAGLLVFVGLFMALWIMLSSAHGVLERLRRHGGLAGLRRIPAGFYGMHLAHVGVAVLVAGVTVVSAFETERHVRMAPGDTLEVAGYEFRFGGVREVAGRNFDAIEGVLRVERNGRHVTTLTPQKRYYRVQSQPMTQASRHPRPWRDLFTALGEPLGDGAWTVRIHFKPMVHWIWGGAGLMVLGGLLAISDRRYRTRRRDDRSPQGRPA